MMRRAPKQDQNQPAIVKRAEARGWSVCSLAFVGKGCADLLLGKGWLHLKIEVKMPGCDLNDRQVDWHRKWKGEIPVVEDLAQLDAVLDEAEFLIGEADAIPNYGAAVLPFTRKPA